MVLKISSGFNKMALHHTQLEQLSIFGNNCSLDVWCQNNGHFECPHRSADWTASDFFLCGYLKSRLDVNKPRTLDELKTNLWQYIAVISSETLVKRMENAVKRALIVMQAQYNHLRDIIFKKWSTQICLNNIELLLK